MPKNVTVYMPDDVAAKMATLPEVNWSEICRQAITSYIEARAPSAGSAATFQVEKPFQISESDVAHHEDFKKKFVEKMREAWGMGMRDHVIQVRIGAEAKLFYRLKKLGSNLTAKETTQEFLAVNQDLKPVRLALKAVRDPMGFSASVQGEEIPVAREEFEKCGLVLNEVFARLNRFAEGQDLY